MKSDLAQASALHLDTLLIHAGQEPDPTTGAVMTPIHLSSTYAQSEPGVHKGFEYARTGNPTRNTLERCLAALEGAEHGAAFASGCAAMTTLLHVLRPGDHVLCGDDVYGGSFRILDKVMAPLGIEATYVDLSEPSGLKERVQQALRPSTRLIWMESPTNPMLKVADIGAMAELVRAHREAQPEAEFPLRLVVDNTFATPCLQRPLLLGADVVVHSTTKYLNGHSDAVGGAVLSSDVALMERVRFLQNAMGAVPSPFDCYLVLRGVKTLSVRMERHTQSAMALASWLEGHPQVEKVYYPGLSSHPQHALASRQMSSPGGMISFVIKGGLKAARALLSTVSVFVCAESLGGVESLIEHPAIMTHGAVPAAQRQALGIDDGLIRISVGLEGLSDLRADLSGALEAAAAAS